MSRLRGRRDDLLIIRGVNLYPSEVERVLLSIGGFAPHYQLIVERPNALDEVRVLCEPAAQDVDREALRDRLGEALREETGLTFAIEVLERDGVPRSEGKALRVIDRRPQ
jgi:phenylacetate-CoA ligase